MNYDFPCVCGHEKVLHPKVGKYSYIVCEGCFRKYINKMWYIIKDLACKEFKADNLKYLERLYYKEKQCQPK